MGYGFLDRYVEGTSLIHKLDPRLKLLGTVAFVLVATSAPPDRWLSLALLATLATTTLLASRVSLLEMLRRSAIVLPFVGVAALSLPFTRAGQAVWTWRLLGWSLIVTDEGLLSFVTVLTKAWLSVLIAGVLVATTPFPSLIQGMRRLRVPGVLTTIVSFMYRYLFVLVDEAMRLRTARESRSAGPGGTLLWRVQVLGGMIGSLLIRSYERSERIYAAMLSRGFDGQIRTLDRLTWRSRDWWAGLGWGGMLICALLAGRMPL